MVGTELKELLEKIQARKCEEQCVEVKAAHGGCLEKLYDTLSAFSNQDSGGTLVFGLDEKQGFKKVGVYGAQDLQKKVMEYGEQMTPVVRPVFYRLCGRGYGFCLRRDPAGRPFGAAVFQDSQGADAGFLYSCRRRG